MIVAGFGFSSSATAGSLASAYAAAGGGAQRLAAPADKCAAPGFAEFAANCALPVTPVAPECLSAAETVTRSPRSLAERGTGSVAEAAALAAAGPGARLIAARALSDDRLATCALAEGDPS